MISSNLKNNEIEKITLNDEKIKNYITNKEIKKIIIIPNKIINIVLK